MTSSKSAVAVFALVGVLASLQRTASSTDLPPPVIIPSSNCNGKALPHPLKSAPEAFSDFDVDRKHYGIDYSSKNEEVHAVANGKIEVIGWDLRALKSLNKRSGLSIQGWGRFVITKHEDGSASLYAHLDRDSTKTLKIGQAIRVGDVLGKTDTTGGATGPHLHFEFTPDGKIFKKSSKVDPNLCILRQNWLMLESYSLNADGIGQVYIDDQLIGENVLHQKTKFWVRLKPGKYSIRIFAKQIASSSPAYFSIEMGEALTILDSEGGDIGPGLTKELHQGQAMTATLQVE